VETVPRHVGLIRAINVGGRHRLPMAELRAFLESSGFAEVRTYLQSGNVVFASAGAVEPAALEAALSEKFGFEITVVLRTPSEMRRIVAGNPFPSIEPTKLHVAFMVEAPPSTSVEGLDVGAFAPEQVVLRGRDAYLHLPGGMGRARLPSWLLGRLGARATVRNWSTVTTLADLADR
jgi:uncharacterized protein (DUF1697 family)